LVLGCYFAGKPHVSDHANSKARLQVHELRLFGIAGPMITGLRGEQVSGSKFIASTGIFHIRVLIKKTIVFCDKDYLELDFTSPIG